MLVPLAESALLGGQRLAGILLPRHPALAPAPTPRSFNNLYTLQGGIQNYMREEGLEHWNGSLFVFDGRMAIRYSEAARFCRKAFFRGKQRKLPHWLQTSLLAVYLS